MIGFYVGIFCMAIIENIRYNKLIEKSNKLTKQIKQQRKEIKIKSILAKI